MIEYLKFKVHIKLPFPSKPLFYDLYTGKKRTCAASIEKVVMITEKKECNLLHQLPPFILGTLIPRARLHHVLQSGNSGGRLKAVLAVLAVLKRQKIREGFLDFFLLFYYLETVEYSLTQYFTCLSVAAKRNI